MADILSKKTHDSFVYDVSTGKRYVDAGQYDAACGGAELGGIIGGGSLVV